MLVRSTSLREFKSMWGQQAPTFSHIHECIQCNVPARGVHMYPSILHVDISICRRYQHDVSLAKCP